MPFVEKEISDLLFLIKKYWIEVMIYLNSINQIPQECALNRISTASKYLYFFLCAVFYSGQVHSGHKYNIRSLQIKTYPLVLMVERAWTGRLKTEAP